MSDPNFYPYFSPEELVAAEQVAGLPESGAKALLQRTLDGTNMLPEQSIFVNRTLRMEKITHVGFDLDWTLADYDRDEMSKVAFEMTLQRLVDEFDYPEIILKSEYRTNFCRRGLILDTKEGTVLKMNRHRYVGRAYFGRRFLNAQERADLYRREPINPSSNRFYHVDTLFELPEVNIFSELIELTQRQPEALRLESYERLFNDTRQAIDSIHRDGTLKARLLSDLGRFLPPDPDIALALRRLALSGRKLLLITNSEWYYTNAVCKHLFVDALPGMDDWTELFDLIIVSAAKPKFFRKDTPFIRLDREGVEQESTTELQWGGIYQGGAREHLMRLTQVPGEQVLYIGDHIYGDVVSSKMSSTWRTALVVSELEDEIRVRRQLASHVRHLAVLRGELNELGLHLDDLKDVLILYNELLGSGEGDDEEIQATVQGIEKQILEMRAEHKSMRRHASRLQSRLSRAINPYWGSLFKQGGNKSLFGSQVDDFACLYTSSVGNFSRYGSRHYYRVTADPMMHESEI